MAFFAQQLCNKGKFLLVRVFFPSVIRSVWWLFPSKGKALLVVKNDGIGDYILFRNFLRELKTSERFRDYRLIVLANSAAQELALHLDADVADRFYWYGDDYFMKWKLVILLLNLQKERFNTILYPNYSRRFTTDWLIMQLKATTKIGVDGDTISESPLQKAKSDGFYSELIDIGSPPVHEFYRNKAVIEHVISKRCVINRPLIEKEKFNIQANNQIILFTGTSNTRKTWQMSSFFELSQMIIENIGLNVLIIRGKENVDCQASWTKLLGDRVQASDSTGLVELSRLIGGARLLISGDTAALHIAAALATPAICIANGDLYGRFVPYPPTISDKVSCVFPVQLTAERRGDDRYSTLSVDDVTAEMVFSKVKSALSTPALPINESP